MNDADQRIEAYLLGQLSETEQHAFEVELQKDKTLEAHFLKQQQEHKMMEFLIEQDLRGKVSNWLEEANTEEVTQNTSSRKMLSKRQWWIIGIAAILCLMFLYFLTTFSSPNSVNGEQQTPELPTAPMEELEDAQNPRLQDEQEEKENKPPVKKSSRPIAKTEPPVSPPDYLALAADFTEPIKFGELYQTRSTEGVDSFALALQNFDEGQFDTGIAYLQRIPGEAPRYLDAQYFLGLALFQAKQPDRAISSLRLVAEEPFYLDAPTAEWYLSLAYLQQGQIQACQQILDRIIAMGEEEPDNPPAYFEEAKRLRLKTLDK